ncbi:MAG: acyl carrier protein [Kiritimatiellae bacterium]|nr:acyl carrier protein [Kiritimatiellia bacterium]
MSVDEVAHWLADYLSCLLKIRADQVDPDLPFDNYGIDSKSAAAMVGDLSAWLKRDLELAIIYDFPSIEALSRYLGAGGEAA